MNGNRCIGWLVALLSSMILSLSHLEAQPVVFNQYYSLNHFFFEFGGSGGHLWSFNYERRIILAEDFKLGARVGFSVLGEDTEITGKSNLNVGNVSIPIILSGQYGKDKHHLEFGLGLTVFGNSQVSSGSIIYPTLAKDVLVAGSMVLGYRLHPFEGGVTLRAVYSPLYTFFNAVPDGGRTLNHWVGVSIGIALKNPNIK